MREYFVSFCDEFDYPSELTSKILSSFDELSASAEGYAYFCRIVSDYDGGVLHLGEMPELSKISGVHEYVVAMLYLIALTKRLKARYEEAGIAYEIYRATLLDILYKIRECEKVYGISGVFVVKWYDCFFNMTIFALGRLQFQKITTSLTYKTIKPGDTLLDVHIPSSGHMPPEACLESFDMAARFFTDVYPSGKPVFNCNSWLLYPKNREFLPKNSNVLKFMDFFEIIESYEDTNFNNCWRIFDKRFTGSTADLPHDSSLRRAFCAWLDAGNPAGTGRGIRFYE